MVGTRHRLSILFVLWAMAVSGQKPSPHKRAQEAYQDAGKALRLNHLHEAITQLSTAIAHDPTFATAHQQLGDIYRKQEQYELAADSYQKVLEIDPKLTPLTYFGLGESLLFSGRYEESFSALTTYRNNARTTENSLLRVDKYLRDCQFAMQQNTQAQKKLTQRLPPTVNTSDDEYFPKLTADNKTLIFTRKTNQQENFYESRWDVDSWQEAEMLVGQINSPDFNEGAHCISPDGKYLFFTGCNWPGGLGSCDLYVSRREDNAWGAPHNLGGPINSKGWEAQPAISADGKTLYFVSNKAGGFGGYDIYCSTLQDNGKWSAPQNLGSQVNSAFDESAPYIHGDGKTLYFASDGWPGFGRKDIFMTQREADGVWSTPVNMGNGINDYRDQTSLHVSMNGRIGHLAAQDSTGKLDIYTFKLPSATQPLAIAYISGAIKDAKERLPISANITITDTKTKAVVFATSSDPDDGTFLATLPLQHNYALYVEKPDYLFESRQYALTEQSSLNESEQLKTEILLKPIEKGAAGILSNIFFDVDQYEILPESATDLDMLVHFMGQHPTLYIEIGGHTDDSGSAQHNKILSERRAEALKSYLTSHGVAAARIEARGYGASVPLGDNRQEQGRQLNRRTSVTIVRL